MDAYIHLSNQCAIFLERLNVNPYGRFFIDSSQNRRPTLHGTYSHTTYTTTTSLLLDKGQPGSSLNKTAGLKIAIPAASGRGNTRFFPCGIGRL